MIDGAGSAASANNYESGLRISPSGLSSSLKWSLKVNALWSCSPGISVSGTGLSRETVGKYIALAEGMGVSREGPGPTEEQLGRLAAISRPRPQHGAVPTEDRLAPWADQIYQWLTGGRLQLTRVQELLAHRGCPVSYASLHRFVARRNWRGRSRRTVRMEDTAPGEVAELDFGRLGLVQDPETGRRRTVWALIVVLGHSRHDFVWPTFSQKLEDVIAGLEAAWAQWGHHLSAMGTFRKASGLIGNPNPSMGP